MWLLLKTKSLKWDVLQKRSYEGLGWCCLYEYDCETNSNLNMTYAYTLEVWEGKILLD